MIDFASRIEKNIRRSKKDTGKNSFETILFNLVKNTSMGVSELCSSPTPLVIELHHRLAKHFEEESKQMKKKR